MTDSLLVAPRKGAYGTVAIPGSKSISNRALLLCALADGTTELSALLESDDTRYMRQALAALGVDVVANSETEFTVRGCGGDFPNRKASLYLGNAGTAVRSLTAVLALTAGEFEIDGIARMRERPIKDLLDALQPLGANIDCLENDGFLPLRLSTQSLAQTLSTAVKGNVSSQYLTGLLMALPVTGKAAEIQIVGELISKPYVAMTIALMKQFGVEVINHDWQRFEIPAGQRYCSPGMLRVEADASSASYYLAAGAIGGDVTIEGVGSDSLQGDVKFADALAVMGAKVEWGPDWIRCAKPEGGQLKAFDLDLNHIPDAAMTLAVAAVFADGPCHLRNIGSWKVKETDRILAMANELTKLGIKVEYTDESLSVWPGQPKANVDIETYDDHRVAMCFSLISLAGVPVNILDPGCTAKTYPKYFEDFATLAEHS